MIPTFLHFASFFVFHLFVTFMTISSQTLFLFCPSLPFLCPPLPLFSRPVINTVLASSVLLEGETRVLLVIGVFFGIVLPNF